MPNNILDILDQAEKDAGSGGAGGDIGVVLTQIGWKVFVAGLSNEESFFPYDTSDDESRKAALAEAKTVVPAGGRDPRPAIQFTMFKNSVLNREVTWQGDRIYTIPTWTDNYKKIIKPAVASLIEQGQELRIGEEQWMRLSFKPDVGSANSPPRTKKNYKFDPNQPVSDSNPEFVPELIAYPAQIFKDKAEAEAAVGQQQVPDATSDIDPFDAIKADPDFINDVKAALKKPAKQQEAALLKVAQDYVSTDDTYNRGILDQMRALA